MKGRVDESKAQQNLDGKKHLKTSSYAYENGGSAVLK